MTESLRALETAQNKLKAQKKETDALSNLVQALYKTHQNDQEEIKNVTNHIKQLQVKYKKLQAKHKELQEEKEDPNVEVNKIVKADISHLQELDRICDEFIQEETGEKKIVDSPEILKK